MNHPADGDQMAYRSRVSQRDGARARNKLPGRNQTFSPGTGPTQQPAQQQAQQQADPEQPATVEEFKANCLAYFEANMAGLPVGAQEAHLKQMAVSNPEAAEELREIAAARRESNLETPPAEPAPPAPGQPATSPDTAAAAAQPPHELLDQGQDSLLNATGVPVELYKGNLSPQSAPAVPENQNPPQDQP